jgi:hypothetical protein
MPPGSAGTRVFAQAVVYRGARGASSVKSNVVQATIQPGA